MFFIDYIGNILIYSFIFGILALSWDILSGYTGQVSFGHAGLFAMGGYVAALLTLHLGISASWSTVLSMVVMALGGLLLGYPALRVRGPYLALITLGFSELLRIVIKNLTSITGGVMGLRGYGSFAQLPTNPSLATLYMYYLVLSVFVVSAMLLFYMAERTRIGTAFKAIREDEILAMALGINITRYKLLSFAVSAAFAGLAGALYAFHTRLLTPVLAGTYVTTLAIAMTIIGGSGSIVGPFLGALLLYNASEYAAFIGPVYKQITIGLLLMFCVIFLPKGILSMGSEGVDTEGIQKRLALLTGKLFSIKKR